MCTALTMTAGCHCFGRTLDLEHHYSESVTVTPRRFPLSFRRTGTLEHHYAIIGMATVAGGYPLYYDAVNEKGLCMAGLNFPGYACYGTVDHGGDAIAPFELIPWLLSQCSSVDEACALLRRLTLTDRPFDDGWPLTPLHWMLADRRRCVVIEPLAQGIVVSENPVGVLTNSPPFEHQLIGLCDHMQLSAEPPVNHFSDLPELQVYSRGMGALGLPGDLSSRSRFVRAAFGRFNSVCGSSEEECICQFFHILGTVQQVRGCVRLEDGCVTTVYTSCCNADRGIYHFTTYEDSAIRGVDMHREKLDGTRLACYPVSYRHRLDIIN